MDVEQLCRFTLSIRAPIYICTPPLFPPIPHFHCCCSFDLDLRRSGARHPQVSWLSWWAQTILSTVAFIILLFSNAVTNRSARGNILGNGVALALASLACSAASICW